MYNSKEKSGFYAALVFLVWPLLALIAAFRNYNSSWGKNILWAFIAFFGFSFAIGAESQGSDIVDYVERLKTLHSTDMDLSKAIQYFLNSGEIDVVNIFLTIFVSRFTGSQTVFLMVYGLIFGFFFSRNMWYVLERLEGKLKPLTILLFVCFFLVIPIWNINGFRMWTAAHVFIYGLLPFLFEGKKSSVLIASLSILFHYSFLVPVGILFSYILLGNRLVIYFVFFITTFFISEIDIEAFNQVIENYTPEILQERTSGYRLENKVEQFRTDPNTGIVWYAVWYTVALKWTLMAFLALLFFQGKKFFLKNKNWLNLFSFTLLFFGCANLLSSIPSGTRFISIANLLALALIIFYIQNREEEVAIKRLIWITLPGLLLFIIVAFRTGLYSISVVTVLGNPFIAFFMSGEFMSLNDLLKSII